MKHVTILVTVLTAPFGMSFTRIIAISRSTGTRAFAANIIKPSTTENAASPATFHPLGPPTFLTNLPVGETFHHPSLNKNITRLSSLPDIFLFRNLIPKHDRESLMEAAALQGMKVAGTKQSGANTIRKHSYLTWIDPHNINVDEATSIAKQTIANSQQYFSHEVMNMDNTERKCAVAEDMQVAKYDVGGKFDYHHDGFGRYLTVLTYLNGVGGTYFPFGGDGNDGLLDEIDFTNEGEVSVLNHFKNKLVGEKCGILLVGKEESDSYLLDDKSSTVVTPKNIIDVQAGDAVAFFNYNSNGEKDLRVLHSGLTVPAEKWIATCWFRSEALTGPFSAMHKDRLLDEWMGVGAGGGLVSSPSPSSTTSPISPPPSSQSPPSSSPEAPLLRVNRALRTTHSRRQVNRLIDARELSVNNVIVTNPDDRLTAGDQVRLNGILQLWEECDIPKHRYIKFHKPKGVVCTTDRRVKGNILDAFEKEEKQVGIEMVELATVGEGGGNSNTTPTATTSTSTKNQRRIFPIGRLDADSVGLILLTSDGSIVNPLLRTNENKTKEYYVRVTPPATDSNIRDLKRGVVITTLARRDGVDGVPVTKQTLPCLVERMANNDNEQHQQKHDDDIDIIDNTNDNKNREDSINNSSSLLRFVIKEGRNRQIRKMCATLGLEVIHLHREAFASVTSSGVSNPGSWIDMSHEELIYIGAIRGPTREELRTPEERARRKLKKMNKKKRKNI